MSNLINFIPDFRNKILNIVSILDNQNNWGLNYVGADFAWQHAKGENIKVAVIDTGWAAHKDLDGNFVEGYDATGNNDYIDHGNFHGCHVTGIIAAECGESMGVKGIAPAAKIIPIKALDDSGMGSYDFVAKALQIAHDLDVDIINMSLGSPIDPGNDQVHNIIKDIATQGKIIICAAGNDGGAVNYPAKYDEVIAVAAVESSGHLAKFSSRGPEVDTYAPGVKIYSTWGNNQYINLDGTSMATPCISGVVALILSWYKAHPDPNFTINYQNVIKLLYDMGDDEQNIVNANGVNISVPKLFNFDPWNTN